ncbi:MAG: hypothetical protein V5A74_03935 [Desulfohalobiaceae bacterium]
MSVSEDGEQLPGFKLSWSLTTPLRPCPALTFFYMFARNILNFGGKSECRVTPSLGIFERPVQQGLFSTAQRQEMTESLAFSRGGQIVREQKHRAMLPS